MTMEAVEFIRTIQKMCEGTNCDVCPLNEKNGCNACYAEDPVGSVRIVEEWAAEQERQKAEQERQKAEQERQKAEQDDIEGAIYRAIASNKTRIENLDHGIYLIQKNLAVLGDQIYALREKVDHTPTMEPSQTQEPKRTNKDVLLAVLPNVDTSACPKVLDMNYKCDKRKLCAVCKHEFWNADAHIGLRRLRNNSTFMVCPDSFDCGDYH